MRKGCCGSGILSFFSLISLTSCAIYQQEFDCPPPVGVPCTSVTDLESMVVETSKGPDLFLPLERESDEKSACSQETPVTDVCSSLKRKVWICHHLTEDGCNVQGHYIYQTQLPNCQTDKDCLAPCDLESHSK